VLHSTRLRAMLVVAATLAIAGVAAAYKLNRWTPIDACLCPTSQHADATQTATATDVPSAKPDWVRAQNDHSSSAIDGQALASVPLGRTESSAIGKTNTSGRSQFAPWGNAKGLSRMTSGSGSAPSVSMGGLWRLMALNSRRHETSATTAVVHTEKPARQPSSPRPAAPPRAPSRPGRPGAPPAPSLPPTTAATPLPTSGFNDFNLPVGVLAGAPDPTSGTLGPGGGVIPSVGGGLATTPEPGTFALLGTGLLGIAGVLRRRRRV